MLIFSLKYVNFYFHVYYHLLVCLNQIATNWDIFMTPNSGHICATPDPSGNRPNPGQRSVYIIQPILLSYPPVHID